MPSIDLMFVSTLLRRPFCLSKVNSISSSLFILPTEVFDLRLYPFESLSYPTTSPTLISEGPLVLSWSRVFQKDTITAFILLSTIVASGIWSDEGLVELHFVRAKEIPALVDQAILPEKLRYSDELHEGFTLRYPELILEIVTGSHYLVKLLTFETTNNTLPRAVIDGLRGAVTDRL